MTDRLKKWMLESKQPVPYSLPIDHPVQDDLAWAADEIERMKKDNESVIEQMKKDNKDVIERFRAFARDVERWVHVSESDCIANLARAALDALEEDKP